MDEDVDALAASLLDCVGAMMDAGFELLGEGVMLGTMPAYLEQLGRRNARYMAKRYVDADADKGAVSALAAMNVISDVTATPYEMVRSDRGDAVKRLKVCEFQAAMEGRNEFAKAMMCRLHGAVYQGSVNGTLEDPEKDGYDVEVRSRILFGDPHCDFAVSSRRRRDGPDDGGGLHHTPDPKDITRQAVHFYGAILVSFVHYLLSVLPETDVVRLLEACRPERRPRLRLAHETMRKTVGADLAKAADLVYEHLCGGDA